MIQLKHKKYLIEVEQIVETEPFATVQTYIDPNAITMVSPTKVKGRCHVWLGGLFLLVNLDAIDFYETIARHMGHITEQTDSGDDL